MCLPKKKKGFKECEIKLKKSEQYILKVYKCKFEGQMMSIKVFAKLAYV